MEKKTGGCHCGKVRYAVEIDLIQPALECNCSHCQIKGLLLIFVPAAQFTLLQGEDSLTEYRFNTEKIGHDFCKVCGVEAFGRGEGASGPTVAVNIRTIDNVDLSTITRKSFNGRDL